MRITSSSIAPILALAFAAACGHSSKTLDAYKQSENAINGGGPDGPGPDVTPVKQFQCSSEVDQQFDKVNMRAYSVPQEVKDKVDAILAAMTPGQKASQMLGIPRGTKDNYQDIERSIDVEVATFGTVRGYNYRDAGHGVNLDAGQPNNRPTNKDNRHTNYATVFPTASLRAASWDLDLERRIGVAIGDETAASLNNMLLAPCMNIIRHPQWGRTQETYSEDVYHTGRLAAAFTVGLQEHVVGCAKHFAANNIEDKRQDQDAQMDEQTLREIYGRHFEMVVQDGAVGCIMASYNKINGVKATQNKHLLQDILKAPVEKGGFGFDGVVLTDWWAMPGDRTPGDASVVQSVVHEALHAGTDIEVPWQLHYSEVTLASEDQNLVKEAARRVLTQKYLYNTAMEGDPWSKNPEKVTSTLADVSIATNAAHEALAQEAARKSAVLLQNGPKEGNAPVLPLASGLMNVAVVGPEQTFSQRTSTLPKSCNDNSEGAAQGETSATDLTCTFRYATDPALGDRGSSRVNGDPARAVGPFDGIKTIAGASRTVTNPKTIAEAGSADAIVVVVGYTPGDEGEEYYIFAGGDRFTLDLPEGHNQFVNDVLALGKPTVIIIESGSIVNLPWLSHQNQNQATIWAGYPGLRGGLALGELVVGGANFSGKMPMAWPTKDIVPQFRAAGTATQMGYFFGYREYDRRTYIAKESAPLVFPFGHGLSYSKFEYSNLTLPSTPVSNCEVVNISVDVKNASGPDGDETAMLFVKPPPKPDGIKGERPWKELKSFARKTVAAGATVKFELPLRIRDLRRWEGGANGAWVVDSGEYTIAVGKNAEDAETSTTTAKLTVNGN